MPVITVDMLEGRTLETKRELVDALTRETARIAGCKAEDIYVIIKETSRENWASSGVLLVDKKSK